MVGKTAITHFGRGEASTKTVLIITLDSIHLLYYSKSVSYFCFFFFQGKNTERCSLVMKAEEIHQALKDAEEICARLKIPWVS